MFQFVWSGVANCGFIVLDILAACDLRRRLLIQQFIFRCYRCQFKDEKFK